MFTKRRLTRVMGLGAVTACLCQASAARATLKLSLSTDTERIAVLEALSVSVTLENGGDVPIGFDPLLFSADAHGALRVVRPSGSSVTVRRPQLRLEQSETHREGSRDSVSLQPGAREELHLVVSCDWDTMHPVFSVAGRYSLTVTYETDEWHVESNEIRVEVVAPPAGDAEALELLRSMRTPEVIYEPGLTFISRWKKALPELERLAALDGSRVYAHYARLSLARRHIILAEGEKDDAHRAASLTAAGNLLDEIATDGFTLAREVAAARDTLRSLLRSEQSPP